MAPVFLICGVSGAGKTWVCKQLTDKFHYIPHDDHFKDHLEVILKASKSQSKPILTEVPFAERLLKEKLEVEGVDVVPYFVIESPWIVKKRYEEREKKRLPLAAWTRASTIKKRADEWAAVSGTSTEILIKLKERWP